MKVLDRSLVINTAIARKSRDHIKEREGIPKPSVSLLGDQLESLILGLYLFFLGDFLEMASHVLGFNPFKIKDLTARKNRRNNFVLFGRG